MHHVPLTRVLDVELPPAKEKVVREINEQAVIALAKSACGSINKIISLCEICSRNASLMQK
jgi:hypothetical protein